MLSDKFRDVNGNPLRKFWLRTHQAWRIFGTGFRRASRFISQKVLAIPGRANSTEITKDLRKVLLGLEATGHCHVQYSRVGGTQHRLSTLKPLPQNKLMRGLARCFAKHPREMSCAQSYRLRQLVETQLVFQPGM